MTTFDATEVRLSYANPLVEKLRDEGELVVGELTFLMPTSFGFCWGVDRALAMVEEARKEYEGRPMWLLSSIIHNPRVNQDLRDKGIRFLKGPLADEAPEDAPAEKLGPSDVVFIPAFSAEIEDMKRLEEKGVQIVDTTCPWVIKPAATAAEAASPSSVRESAICVTPASSSSPFLWAAFRNI